MTNPPAASNTLPASAQQTPTQQTPAINWSETIPFILVHIACFGALWTGVSVADLWLCLALYVTRMFGITAGYHRYFAHRSFKTSRTLQFLLALLAQSSAQRGHLWWAAKHRDHHKYADTPKDAHSPRQFGFWFSHCGWIFSDRLSADMDRVRDFSRYPELRWLDRMTFMSPILLGVAVWALFGWSGLVVGFFWSTVLLWHGTYTINSLAHVWGQRRYLTGDDSRNNAVLALITLGEGWHNNHHYYQASARQGFRWYEIDMTYYVLRLLQLFGLVWDMNKPPAHIVAGQRRASRFAVEQSALQLAQAYQPEELAQRLHESWQRFPEWRDQMLCNARERLETAEAWWDELELMPQWPDREQLQAKARQMFAQSPSLDQVALRAQELLAQHVRQSLVTQAS